MGVESIIGNKAVRVALEVVKDSNDVHRRRSACKRRQVYEDDFVGIVKDVAARLFNSPEVIQLLKPFIEVSGAMNLFKRVVDEISRPVYSITPRRRIVDDAAANSYLEIGKQMKLDARMDYAVRMTNAMNHCWLYPRYLPRLNKFSLEVITPDVATVIPHPDDPSNEMAFIYSIGKDLWAYWDDTEQFWFDKTGEIKQPFAMPRMHGLGRIPIVSVRRLERCGCYWDMHSGSDLFQAQMMISILTAMKLKLHKSQGERQLVFQGDTYHMPTEQTLDGESPLVAPDGVSVTQLDMRSDARHYADTIDQIIVNVASNYGLNRDRINATTSNAVDDLALLERRADMIKIFRRAEHELFDLVKLISKQSDVQLSDAAELKHVDYGEIEARVDFEKQLSIWEEMEKKGLRSYIDNIKALNPEITSDEEAFNEYMENIERWAERVKIQRELNAPADGEPGSSAQKNGAMGPAVRDGKMSRGQARDASYGDIDALIAEVIQ